MRDIVIKILQNYNFNNMDIEFDFYTNSQKSEYFIVSKYSQEELHNFFEDNKTSQIIKKFEKFSEKLEHQNIRKNTSLLILVEVDNLEKAFEDEDIKRSILLIEEDYYYFRKLILLYTNKGLQNLQDKLDNYTLYNFLESKMNSFEDDMFFDDSYFIAMEIGIKMPFFTIPERNDIYQTIENQCHDDMDELDERLLEFYKNVDEDKLSESLRNISTDDNNISELLQIGESLS